MKKLVFLFACFVTLLSLASCEEEESLLLFAQESVSNPENVKMEYYSPDPCCLSKMYWIDADCNAGELTLECTNADDIYFKNSDATVGEFRCEQGQWTARIIGSRTIVISFDEIDYDKFEDSYLGTTFLNVAAMTKKGELTTGISVTRWIEPNRPQ